MKPGATGAHFEQLALERMERAGLKLVERNYRTRFGELDLIMRDGRRLEKNGLTPDAIVARTAEDRRAGRDPQLEAAIRLLSENNPPG